MWSITITLGQLLIAILIFFILRSVWYKIDKNKWNQGICKKCNKGNYRYVMMTLTNWNDILNIFNMSFNYQCNHCNKKIKINIFFDKLTSNYITVDTPQYRKFIRKEKLKKLK